MAITPRLGALVDSRRNRALLVWSVALLGLCAAVVYLYLEQRAGPATVPVATSVPEVAPKPEVKLTVVVTECSQITSRVDFTGGIMVNLGENYRQVKGHVINKGDLPVSFVHVDTIWKNTEGKIIQTGTVYLAMAEGLKPGEQVEFSDSTQNYLVATCGARVRDWWIATDPARPLPDAGETRP